MNETDAPAPYEEPMLPFEEFDTAHAAALAQQVIELPAPEAPAGLLEPEFSSPGDFHEPGERPGTPPITRIINTENAVRDQIIAGQDKENAQLRQEKDEIAAEAGRREAELKTQQEEERVEHNRRAADKEKLRITDRLTQVLNRDGLYDKYSEVVVPGLRATDTVALLMIDLDKFKEKNDTYGHPMGDAVLRQSTHRLQAALRPKDFIGRWGGEEFIVLLTDTDPEEALVVAERLRSTLDNSHLEGEVPIHQTASIGVSMVDARRSLDENVKPADEAMYLAKKNGRNRVEASYSTTPKTSS
jgi:diguanylate cyclase (GGDEF)-like protein